MMLTKKLFRTAWSYKSQFLSMILMSAIGMGIFLGFNMEWHSIKTNTSSFFESTKYADYRIYSEKGFSKKNIEKIKDIDDVEEATRYLSVNVELKDTSKTVTLNVSEDYTVSTMLITDGEEYNKDTDGIWLSDRFAQENDISIGDTLTFVYQGFEISGNVVGLCKSSENMICVADSTQLMPDYTTHGFAYISPKTLKKAIDIDFYPQINILSAMPKAQLETAVKDTLGTTLKITDKDLHTAYAGAQSEIEEGQTMGSILPVLFLAIAILTMVTTMHRIAANEKVQIGTLKALGFRDRKILWHYTSYGLFIGIVGGAAGILLGYGIAAFIMNPSGMMSTYFDLPEWKLTMPAFCIPVLALTILLLTLISYLSTKKMLAGTAADALRPYTPKAMKKSVLEKISFVDKLPFSIKWNLRDILRHKARSGMTLLGIFGCTLLIVGGLGMRDTMVNFLHLLGDDISNYATKITVAETADNKETLTLCDELNGSWQSTLGISYNGNTSALEIYSEDNDKIRLLTENNQTFSLENNGVYLCLRLKDSAKIGDTIDISPYGSEETYHLTVLGYYRSLFSEGIAISETYAKKLGIDYHIGTIYTDVPSEDIETSSLISGKQDKDTVMASYDTFLELMNLMIGILIIAAAILGMVVLYNLGIMSYVERRREFATLKVLGFRDSAIGRLLINQNTWLTLLGILIGVPGGAFVLKFLVVKLASEYELNATVSPLTCAIGTVLTLGVSLLVSAAVARKNKKINMVEALKGAE